MDPDHIGAAAETHLSDLLADIEAGSRLIHQIHHDAAHIRDALAGHLALRAIVESLITHVAKLKACVMQQRALMRDLRHDIRNLRDLTKRQRSRKNHFRPASRLRGRR